MASELLKGEGETKVVVRRNERRDCDNCGEPATRLLTFLMPDARRNPASKAYGRDDCSWCSDYDAYACDACAATGVPEGYGSCATFPLKNFPHMGLKWRDRDAPDLLTAASDMQGALAGIQSLLADWIVPDSGISDHEVLNAILNITDHRDVLAQQQAALAAIAKATTAA